MLDEHLLNVTAVVFVGQSPKLLKQLVLLDFQPCLVGPTCFTIAIILFESIHPAVRLLRMLILSKDFLLTHNPPSLPLSASLLRNSDHIVVT
jgi:hypothetical protein